MISAGSFGMGCINNGFSDMNKSQMGQDQQRKDMTDDHQGKALKEGFSEIRWAQMSAASKGRLTPKGTQ